LIQQDASLRPPLPSAVPSRRRSGCGPLKPPASGGGRSLHCSTELPARSKRSSVSAMTSIQRSIARNWLVFWFAVRWTRRSPIWKATPMHDPRPIALRVNGRSVEVTVGARVNLADFLRPDLRLPGTHVGCEHGVCGACTVLVDGASARSCLMLAVQANGRRIETVESLANGSDLHPL